jgi:4-hydroxy-3-methylbut-2-en-1-yl diphosphate reductase
MGNKSIKVEIDKSSGFCFGVVNAISQAEEELKHEDTLFCLGEIVHNNEEVNRLNQLGLRTVSHEDLSSLKGKRIMLRAHGEPPETYKIAAENNISLIDASCPVVLKLQVKVREGWKKMNSIGGQVVIFGKKGHAEVVGLVGQTQGNAIVIENVEQINSLDFAKPTELFSQTTMSSDEYKSIAKAIEGQLLQSSKGKPVHFKAHNSICGQVANRKVELSAFAAKFDAVVFVSGKSSSNGKMLFEVCKAINPKTYFVSSAQEISSEWFKDIQSVGICGATSTPLWLMEQAASTIKNFSSK